MADGEHGEARRHAEVAPADRALSDLAVRLIQVLFAITVGQAVLRNPDVITEPWADGHRAAALALVVFLFFAVRSWLDWHLQVANHPYRIDPMSPHRSWEQLRVWVDLSFVVVYAFLVFTAADLTGAPDADLTRHLGGYAAAYGLFLVTNLLRDRTYGAHHRLEASTIAALAAQLALIVVYDAATGGASADDREAWNLGVLVAVAVVAAAYRGYRARIREPLVNLPA